MYHARKSLFFPNEKPCMKTEGSLLDVTTGRYDGDEFEKR